MQDFSKLSFIKMLRHTTGSTYDDKQSGCKSRTFLLDEQKQTDKSSEYLNTDVTRDDNVRGITVTHALCSLQTVSNTKLTS